jgi:hypothetical protein
LIRPNEAAGLTAALARAAAGRAADLAALITNDTYRAELTARGRLQAAYDAGAHLAAAALDLEGLANVLAEPTAPHCGHCGAAVADPETHTCEVRT